MKPPCPLCECEAASREVHHAFLKAIDEQRDWINYVGLKYSLFVWNPIEPAIDNGPAD